MKQLTKFKRLDKHLLERGLVATLPRAQQLISAGAVRVNGAVITAPQCPINDEHRIDISGIDCPWVSSHAMRLFTALETLKLDVKGMIALDLGAGAGGFTEVLLQKQTKKVYAVEKDFGLLDPSLSENPRVKNIYNSDAKSLTKTILPEDFDLIVSDIPDEDIAASLSALIPLTQKSLDLLVFVSEKKAAKEIERQIRIDHAMMVKKVPETLQKDEALIWLQKRAL